MTEEDSNDQGVVMSCNGKTDGINFYHKECLQ